MTTATEQLISKLPDAGGETVEDRLAAVDWPLNEQAHNLDGNNTQTLSTAVALLAAAVKQLAEPSRKSPEEATLAR